MPVNLLIEGESGKMQFLLVKLLNINARKNDLLRG